MKIAYTILENTTANDPLYLQNLTYDQPYDLATVDEFTLEITIPTGMSAYIIDDLHFRTTKTNHIKITLHESSQVTYKLFVANHQLCETCPKSESCQTIPAVFDKSLTLELKEPNAQAYVKCHYLGDQASQFHLATKQYHYASNTTSKLEVKGVLDDHAKLVSDNKIVVTKDLHNVVAEQTNKNLLLCDNAHVITIPKMEIDSQDVACKHGASVTALDPNALFYLQSRGIQDAERMLIEAFLHI